MHSPTAILYALLASSPIFVGASAVPSGELEKRAVPYFCRKNTGITYETGVALQTAIVNHFAKYNPKGLTTGPAVVFKGTDIKGAQKNASIVVHSADREKNVVITAAMVQSATGQILSGCVSRGWDGYIMLDGALYIILS